MGSERRYLLWLLLSVGILFTWFELFGPKPVPKKAEVQATPTSTATATSTATPTTGSSPTGPKTVMNVPVPARTARPKTLFKTELPLYNVTFSDTPGSPADLRLKGYKTTLKKDAEPVTVLPFRGEGPPLEWRLEIGGQALSETGLQYTEVLREPAKVVYEAQLPGGLQIRKSYAMASDNYILDHEIQVTSRAASPLKLRAEAVLRSGTEGNVAPSMFNPGDPLHLVTYINEKSLRLVPEKVAPAEIPPGDIQWAGFESRYFLFAAAPVEGRWAALGVDTTKATDPQTKKEVVHGLSLGLQYPPTELVSGTPTTYKIRFFTGPKDIGLLEKAGYSLEKAIDLGDWLGPIARPILYFLRWLYTLIPNFGVAIILLTVLVRLLLFPFAQAQAKSAKKMQIHKPEMDALKEKYKDNKEAYSRELMAYMKRYKINPMGGCLLLLPQMPIFFALYRVLYNSIELRHAPFVFWLRDLSAHDPFFVLPILLGGAMLIQQRMTPMPGMDPNQAAMMKWMPVIFTGLMIFLPAGLNLYILVSTLWGIAQQYWVSRGGESGIQPGLKVALKS